MINAIIAAKDDRGEGAFFREDCMYIEMEYFTFPGLVEALLLAGMPDGSRIVAKYDNDDTRFILSAFRYQEQREIYYAPAMGVLAERYYMRASADKFDRADWYMTDEKSLSEGWNAVIVPSLPEFSARLYIETDRNTHNG